MSESLWAARTDDLLRRTASPDPTPGGGSVAAVVGALGVGLMLMAVAITGEDDALTQHERVLSSLRERIVHAADQDTRDFEALMAAYRLPGRDDADRNARTQAIEEASIAATESPLALVEALAEALAVSHELEPLVKASVVSDVLAGRDVAAGAARAAIRTADINLRELDRLSSPAAPGLRARRDELANSVEAAA
ncbi:cyclodeaminase/cyclohydrolase family protein [Leifsonia sp. SIMBA_070]|uniref:cyclodeaminase/cyclohydrolase family protein n=1 Tax=Leifsonia sp. SIMBA_070 TaxID=3085810 RepID=UPI003978C99D